MDQQQPCVGEAGPGCARYVLDVFDFVQPLDPPPQFDMESLNPNDYFVTSGDAVQKTRYLSEIVWAYAGTVRKQLRKMKRPSKAAKVFEKLCWKQAGGCTRMLNALIKVRGEAVFLETEWNSDRKLLCIPKNPRSVKAKPKVKK
jgi:hypothetical protein